MSTAATQQQTTNTKKRAPRACKNETFMQEKLAQYKTSDPTCPTCWHAYKFAKADEKEMKREEKEEQKKNQPPVERIRQLLSEAARRSNFSEKLAQTPGKEKQAAGMKKSAEKAMDEAVNIYQGLAPDDHRHLDEQEVEWLSRRNIPLLNEYFDVDAEGDENRKIEQNKQIEKLIQERENLCRRLSDFERELAVSKQLSRTMKQELYELHQTVKDKEIKKRLKKILDEAESKKV